MTGRNKFMLGAIAGASAIVAAIPFVVQMSSAASGMPATTSTSTSSVTTQQSSVAPDTDKEVPDAQEAPVDASQAKISADAAAQAALQAQPGTVHENTLDNEHGNLAYKVEITNAGKEYDVLVDAVSGKVLKNWEDGQGGPHHDDANEGNDNGAEAKDAPGQDASETGEQPGQSDQNEQDGAAPTSAATSSAQ